MTRGDPLHRCVHRIALDNHEFEGQNNAYLLHSDGAVALIDTGVGTPPVRAALEAGLRRHGCRFEDVDLVFLTHWHPDHAGLAGAVQAAGGATVLVHEADAPLVRRDGEAWQELTDRQSAAFEDWGIPAAARSELRERLSGTEDLIDPPPAVETIGDGDRVTIGDRTLRVRHAPGHAAGLCCFETDGEQGPVAFVGDAVLPVYTPNVGGADVRVERPLERYLRTLRSIAERDYDRLWPGHRGVIEAPTDRALAIVEHHRERTRRVVVVLREHGPADAWTVSARLFGDLEGIHILHGPGEAFAHLDHLHRHGAVERTPAGYRLVDPDPSIEGIV